MRKFLLIVLPVLLVISSSFILLKSTIPPAHRKTHKLQFSPQDWIIPDTTAERMTNYFNDCKGGKCRRHQKKTFNFPTDIDNYIKKNYDVVNSWLQDARYDDADVPRYRKARNFDPADKRAQVSGYSTVLTVYKVKQKGDVGFLAPVFLRVYVDNATICPPPELPPCN